MRKKLIALLFTCLSTLSASEKVYALMVTGKDSFHYELALRSIDSFLGQTYENKELIIVNDGDYSFDHLDNSSIREIHLETKCTLGELRNVSLSAVPEDGIWIQWDDDDWHHESLIEKQYAFMMENEADACCLQNQAVYCFSKNCAWTTSTHLICGTFMGRRKPDVFYLPMRKEEDAYFIQEYSAKYKVALWPNPAYYYLRFVHGHNTWEDEHFQLGQRKSDEWLIGGSECNYLIKVLPQYDFIQ